ncbi:MAG: hypothetical protein M3Z00_13740 [Actinomycetota bacterium]|nr:hypothetical protein [Actinomycetota bacterium]
MQWWRWLAATVEAALLVVLLLLWFDTLREKPGWTIAKAAQRPAIGSVIVPIGFGLVLLLPLWIGLVLIAIPAIAVGAMALAS